MADRDDPAYPARPSRRLFLQQAGAAKPGFVDTSFSDHSSVLKFIEAVFGLPTLASINHQFDKSTPRGSNHQANGAPFPPRDGKSALSDLTQCFTFG